MPDMYAASIDKITETMYTIINRKIFSLPKILLLPRLMFAQPRLMGTVFPAVMALDFVKAKGMAYLTTSIEEFSRDLKELEAKRRKLEEYDLQHAVDIVHGGATATKFTMKAWSNISEHIQLKQLQHNFLLQVLDSYVNLQVILLLNSLCCSPYILGS